MDNRLKGDVRMYGVDNEIDVNFDYCDEILKLMDIVRFGYIYMGRRSRLCIYIRITGFKLWHSLDALATAHLTVIVS